MTKGRIADEGRHPKLPLLTREGLRAPIHTYMVPWAHPTPNSERHLDRFSRFCRTYGRVQQTNQHTDDHATSVAISHRIVHTVHAMRSNNSLPLSATDMFSGGTETGRVDEDGGATSAAAAAAAAAVSSTASSGFTSSMTISISSSSSFFADAAPPQINRRQIDKGYSTQRGK